MKVLYFTRDYTPHDYRFLKAIIENGHDVYDLRLEKRVAYESRPLPEKVKVVDWNWGKKARDPSNDDLVVNDLKRIVSEIHPDVIHTGPIPDVSWLAACADVHPHTAMSWGFDLQKDINTSKLDYNHSVYALQKADWFLGDCNVELHIAEKLGFEKTHSTIFPWGIDITRFSPGKSNLREKFAGSDDFLMLCLRTMEPNYDVGTVVRAFLKAAEKEPKLKLVLMSDGSQRQSLMEESRKKPEEKRIFWVGRQSNDLLVDYYRSADLYVSASLVDGTSVSLLEAMGCGIPVLMSAIAGNLEWVKDGENGLLFQTGNVSELSEKMLWCFQNRNNLVKFAANGRNLICEKADWDKNKFLLTKAYQGAINVCGQLK